MNPRRERIASAPRLFALAALILLACGSLAHAGRTRQFLDATFEDFQKGQVTTSTLSSEGWLTLPPDREKIYAPIAVDSFWDATRDAQGRVFLGGGAPGRVFMIDENSSGSLYCPMEETHIFTVRWTREHGLLAGGAPGGKLWKITGPEKRELFAETGQTYVWDLLPEPDGSLLAATGGKSRIVRISPKGTVTTVAEIPDTKNVLALARDAQGRLLAVTQGKARLLRLNEKGEPFVIYAPEEDEIRRVAVDAAGRIWIAVNGGSDSSVSPGALAARIRSGASAQRASGNSSPDSEMMSEEGPMPSPRMRAPRGDGGGGSSLICLDGDGFVALRWEAPEPPIHDLAPDARGEWVYVAAGASGALFRVNLLGRHEQIGGVREKGILRLAREDSGALLALSNGPGVLYRFFPARTRTGEYLSSPFDAETPARWGRARIEGAAPAGARILFATRSGATEDPERFWSAWSEEREILPEQPAEITSPPARRIQYRLRLESASAEREGWPRVESVRIPYTAPNQPPVVKEVQVSPQTGGGPSGGGNRPGGGGAPSMMRRPGQDSGPQRPSMGGAPPSNRSRAPEGAGPREVASEADSNASRMTIQWVAEDPNGDTLRFTVFIRAEGDTEWVRLAENVEGDTYELDTTQLPDGRFRARVSASDRPSNLPQDALEDERASDPFVVDDSKPRILEIEQQPARMADGAARITFRAQDELSILASAEWRLNDGAWQFLAPEDAIFDSLAERFVFEIPRAEFKDALSAMLTVRVTDERGNTAIAQKRVTIQAASR